jgi:hypothetical protein
MEDWDQPYSGNSSRPWACNSARCSRALDSDFDNSRIQSQGNHFLSPVTPTGYDEQSAHWGFQRDYAQFAVNTHRFGSASGYRSIVFRKSLDAEAGEGQAKSLAPSPPKLWDKPGNPRAGRIAEIEESHTPTLKLSWLQSYFEPAKTPQPFR